MLVFHVYFDLRYFGKITLNSPFWYFFPRFIGGMFIFISGISLTFARKKYGKMLIKVTVKRALSYLSLALLITLLTFPTNCYVRFGILHFFAVAVVLGSFFTGYMTRSFITGVLLILAGMIISGFSINGEYLLWLGVMPYNFCTLDYYPLLPWFGLMLLGIAVGNKSELNLKIPDYLNPVVYLGRKSLLIYMIQHPLILLMMQVYYGDIIEEILRITGIQP